MIWLLSCLTLASAQLPFYDKGGNNMYIVKPRPTFELPGKEEFHEVFARDAVKIKLRDDGLKFWLPICTVNDKNRCDCDVVNEAHTRDRCISDDGRRDLQGNCHVQFARDCYVHSDFRINFKPYKWGNLNVYVESPYFLTYETSLTLNGANHEIFCYDREVCSCSIRNSDTKKTTSCRSYTGPVVIDEAINRCHIAVKTFEDGSWACFPIDDPRPSKADLEVWTQKYPEGTPLRELAISFVDTKPDGIVFDHEIRPRILLLKLVEPKPPVFYSTINPVFSRGSFIQFHIPLTPFAKNHKHKLLFPDERSTRATCAHDGVTLHLFDTDHKCKLVSNSDKAMFTTDNCNVFIDLVNLKALYKAVKADPTFNLGEDAVCFSLSSH